MSRFGPTYYDFNWFVRLDLSSQGHFSPTEFLFHSKGDADRKHRQLKARHPRDPVYVMSREEYGAERRAADLYSRQDCS